MRDSLAVTSDAKLGSALSMTNSLEPTIHSTSSLERRDRFVIKYVGLVLAKLYSLMRMYTIHEDKISAMNSRGKGVHGVREPGFDWFLRWRSLIESRIIDKSFLACLPARYEFNLNQEGRCD